MVKRALFLCCLVALPGLVLAGPNEGGVLLVHANPSLTYTTDQASYCGMSGLSACSLAVTSVPWEPETTTVFYVLAAFAEEAQPRLKAVSWGVEWDASKLVIAAHGSCADFDVPDGTWPASGTGIGQSFTETRTGPLTELYWFSGYAYGAEEDTTSFRAVPHPAQGAVMVDDAVPPNEDEIAAFGRVGFGITGYATCPGGLDMPPDGPPPPDPEGSQTLPCQIPSTVILPDSSLLMLYDGTSMRRFRGEVLSVSHSPSDSLRINGIPAVPVRTRPSTDLSDERLLQLYGSVPFVERYSNDGHDVSETVEAYHLARSLLASAARTAFEEGLAQGATGTEAARRALDIFRASPLVDPATTYLRDHSGAVRQTVVVVYRGDGPIDIDLVPLDPVGMSPKLSDRACALLRQLELLQSATGPAYLRVDVGGTSAGGGAAARPVVEGR